MTRHAERRLIFVSSNTGNWKNYCVTLIFLIINVAVYIFYIIAGERVFDIGSLSADAVIGDGEFYRLITCTFLHADAAHIVGNMIFAVGLGEMLEREAGHWRFAVLYLVSGLGGSLFSLTYMVMSAQNYRSVGASGAISGFIGALLVLVLANNGRYGAVSLGRIILGICYMIYTGVQSTTTDNAAHIGGLVCGFLVMLIMQLVRRGRSNP